MMAVKQFVFQRPAIAATAIALLLLIGVVVSNALIIKYRGQPVPVPDIPRTAERYGEGSALQYAVFGDSTTVAQGSAYDKGYVRATARYLADRGYAVVLHNFGVSGARAADIPARQIPRARKQAIRPDIALVAVTANDVTHLTGLHAMETNLARSIELLRSLNPDVQIILTGSPQMGTIPRFPQPARYLAKVRTGQVNGMIRRLAAEKQVLFAPIADKTGPLFAAHPEYYAADLFHPNEGGYATWTPVLTDALNTALDKQ